MSEEQEVETRELQEAIEELHQERAERKDEEASIRWLRYIALTTALLAVFAAIGALQSGSQVNQAMIYQLKASDAWNEYQAARQKDHLYMVSAFALIDRGAQLVPHAHEGIKHSSVRSPKGDSKPTTGDASTSWAPKSPDERAAQYIEKRAKESEKEAELQKEARKLEKESEESMHRHHRFAGSVALIQVAISLGAIASLTRMRAVWIGSMAVGLFGILFFAFGTMGL